MNKYRKMLQLGNPSIDEMMKLLSTQSKTTICTWAINYAEQIILPIWVKNFPHDKRPQTAICATRQWLAGKIKLPQAKPAILDCIAAAREAESNPTAQTAARTIHQAAASIHSPRHSIGLALYGALAVAYNELGVDAPWVDLEHHAALECDRMLAALQTVSQKNEPNPAKIKWYC